MSEIVIVADRCYLICEKVNYIATNVAGFQDVHEDEPVLKSSRKKKKRLTKQEKLQALKDAVRYYEVTINFNPVGQGLHGSQNLTITCLGKKETMGLYGEIVKQIREQMPDKMWLDTLVNRFFTENEENLKG